MYALYCHIILVYLFNALVKRWCMLGFLVRLV